MACVLKESTNVHKLSDVKAVLDQLRVWSEKQRQTFLNKQLIEHKNLLEQSGIRKLEQQINQGYLSRSTIGNSVQDGKRLHEIVDRNLSGSDTTLQDSSVTGHILRCFSDSSFDSSTQSKDEAIAVNDKTSAKESNFTSDPSLNKNEDNSSNAVTLPLKRPKQPFLKKRSGLSRYLPKQNKNVTKTKNPSVIQNSDSEPLVKPILKFNPDFHVIKSFPQKINHVKFNEHESLISNKILKEAGQLYDIPESNSALNDETSSSGEDCSTLKTVNSKDERNNCNESLNMEKKELAEFEMLENCAQNSSFNSDSSIVQRLLNVKSVQPQDQIRSSSSPIHTEFDFDSQDKVNMDKISDGSEKLNLGDFLEEQRKQRLQDIILDTDLRIASLQKKTHTLNKDAFYEENYVNERCSTPVDVTNKVNGLSSPAPSDSESSRDSSSSSVIFNLVLEAPSRVKVLNTVAESDVHLADKNENKNCLQNNKYGHLNSPSEQDDMSTAKAKLCQKMEELEKEIQTYQELNLELKKEKQIYQEHNLHLASIRSERDENLKKLQRAWDEFQKHKEDEEKKLEDKRRQLQMREETFNRYQKLRKDNPSRKEREETSVLRRQVEELQEELKRQRIKFNNENKRLKNQLIAAEQERDNLKLENITLEEQCQDLLATFKSRNIRNKPAAGKKNTAKKKEAPTTKNISNNDSMVSRETVTKNSHDLENDKVDVNSTKPRVRFNLVPQFENGQMESIQGNFEKNNEGGDIVCNASCETNGMISAYPTPTDEEPNKEELPYEEIKHDDKIERTYFSGEKEIIRPSGIIKHISADGKTVTYRYPNGDVKEIYPDSSVICKFITGVIEKRFPGGIEVTEHPNGQIEKRSPGLEEVKFPDGTTQTRHIFPDGSEQIEFPDGTHVTVAKDGTEIAQFKNGVKEIRTANYKRKEYPDGSVKIIYEDGSQETRYSNGRVKKKDKDGRILLDTQILQNEFSYPCQRTACS